MSEDVPEGQEPSSPRRQFMRRDEIVPLLLILPALLALAAFAAHLVHLFSWRVRLWAMAIWVYCAVSTFWRYKTDYSSPAGPGQPWPMSLPALTTEANATLARYWREDRQTWRRAGRQTWLTLFVLCLLFGVMLWLVP